jgi:rhodanese-related sulfurtransferase
MNNSRFHGVLALILCIFFASLGVAAADEHLLPPLEAQKFIADNRENPKFVIIDLRSKNEFDSGHIEGAKLVHYYATNFKRIISKLDRDSIILFYCQKGRQSPLARRDLEKLRFTDMYILDGGFDEWVNAGLPIEYTEL